MGINDFISQSLRVLWYRRRRMFIATVSLALLSVLVSIIWLNVYPLYEGKTVVTMLPSDAEIGFASQQTAQPGSSPALTLSQTHTEFLMSNTIAGKVIDTLLSQYKEEQKKATIINQFTDKVLLPALDIVYQTYCVLNYGEYKKPTEKEILTSKIRSRIKVKNVPGSYILSISVLWTDPHVAQQAANYLADIYVENSKNENKRSLSETKKFIENKLDYYKKELFDLEDQAKDFKKKSNISIFSKDVTMLMDEISQYIQEKNRLELKLLELESKNRNFKEIETQTNKLNYTADYESTKDRIASVQKIIDDYNVKLQKIPNIELQLFGQEQKRKSIEANIEGLQNDLIKTNISEAGTLSAIRIIDSATISAYQKYPKVLLNLLVAIALGIFLGFGWILISETLSPRIRYKGDLKSTNIKFLGLVPRIYENTRRMPWHRFTRASSVAIEKHIQFIIDSITDLNENKIVQLVSFANTGLLFNLITEFISRMPSLTLIVNIDKIAHEKFMGKIGTSVSLLNDDSNAVQTLTVSKNVDYFQFVNDNLDKNGISLLSGHLRKFRQHYRFIFIITPALNTFSSASFLASHVDSNLLLLRAQVESQKKMLYFENVFDGIQKPCNCFMVGVEYPGDFLFS